MSLHKCPECRKFGFVWKVDYDISSLTIWDCWECGYTAFEDESLESFCTDCSYKYRIQLQVDDTKFWWCTECETKTIIIP